MAFDQLERPSLAARLDAELRHAHPATVLESAVEAFGDKLALVSSFGAESVVLLHMVSLIAPGTPVIFIDTLMLFQETLDYQREVSRQLGLTDVRTITAAQAMLDLEDPDGTLHQFNQDACCALRKTVPLEQALSEFDAWITGRKRFQGGERQELDFFESEPPSRLRINPLAHWRREDVQEYMAENNLPRHPLVAKGYASIGCAPCTSPIKPGEDPRAGRWRGQAKTECGIHFIGGKMVRAGANA